MGSRIRAGNRKRKRIMLAFLVSVVTAGGGWGSGLAWRATPSSVPKV